MNQRKFPEAQQEFIASLNLDPSRGAAYDGLATVAAENQNYLLVLKVLEARAKLLPETPGTYFFRASSYDHLHDVNQTPPNYHLFLSLPTETNPNHKHHATP